MKTISLVFQSIQDKPVQVEWAINELINPTIHQIVLIFIMPEKMYIINDPWAMLLYNKLSEFEQETIKNDIKEFLNRISNRFKKEFESNFEVMKLVIHGNERCKLDACLTSLGSKMVVLGPDSIEKSFNKIFFKSLDEFITNNIMIPIVRIPKNYE